MSSFFRQGGRAAALIASFAVDILCDVAGASKTSFQNVAARGVLPQSRLQTCPGQYQQDVDSITQKLRPHLRGNIDLSAPH